MSNYQVTQFNHISGKAPKGFYSDSAEDIWEQLQGQAALILEEAKELYEAAMARNIVEYVDRTCDVWYLREYTDDLMLNLNINIKGAKDEVCYNNSQKYTTSKELAYETAKAKQANVHEVWYNGDTYYVVKDSNNKVQKLLGHVPPDLSKYIPIETKEKLTYESN